MDPSEWASKQWVRASEWVSARYLSALAARTLGQPASTTTTKKQRDLPWYYGKLFWGQPAKNERAISVNWSQCSPAISLNHRAGIWQLILLSARTCIPREFQSVVCESVCPTPSPPPHLCMRTPLRPANLFVLPITRAAQHSWNEQTFWFRRKIGQKSHFIYLISDYGVFDIDHFIFRLKSAAVICKCAVNAIIRYSGTFLIIACVHHKAKTTDSFFSLKNV
jgi:hypothetical protein